METKQCFPFFFHINLQQNTPLEEKIFNIKYILILLPKFLSEELRVLRRKIE